MTEDQRRQVESLVAKAANTDKPDDAMKFSQAACNAAAAFRQLAESARGLREAAAE